MSDHIIISGNPVDGFEFYGPFSSEAEAVEFAERDPRVSDSWHVGGLINPASKSLPCYRECEICNDFHPVDFEGDCRDDAQRFTLDALDQKHGEDGYSLESH